MISDDASPSPVIGKTKSELRGALDPSLYSPSSAEISFLKSQTGIQDDDELKEHVLNVQKEAWEVFPYRSIQSFGFITLKITHLPAYKDLLALGKARPDAIFLDYACCFGNDSRKAIADGYPMANVIGSDIEGAFWDLGHKLYKTTRESYPVPFVRSDVFDPLSIAPAPPHYTPPTTPRPVLSTLTSSSSLTPLRGHVAAIHTASFFHLFTREDQIRAAYALASLLSPIPGSMIFGVHTSARVSGERELWMLNRKNYCFSPGDWCELWDGEVFEKGSVSVEARLIEDDPWRGKGYENDPERKDPETRRFSMVWSVKRV